MLVAAVFDMDGVLVDSEPLWREAEIELFGGLGVTLTEEQCAGTMGMRVDEVVDHWYARHPWPDPDHPGLATRLTDRVADLIAERARPLSGVPHALDLCRRRGLRLAVASSSRRRLIDAVLDRCQLTAAFAVVHSAEDEPYGKPHPGIYLTTAARLGADPTRCVAIEDSVNGVVAAKAARMRCIAVPDQRSDRGVDPRFVLADVVLDSLEDLADEHLA